jgi:hypothetical protein
MKLEATRGGENNLRILKGTIDTLTGAMAGEAGKSKQPRSRKTS